MKHAKLRKTTSDSRANKYTETIRHLRFAHASKDFIEVGGKMSWIVRMDQGIRVRIPAVVLLQPIEPYGR